MSRRTLFLCTGSHCRKALAKHDRVERALARLPVEVKRVGCQKVCRGPVVGLALGGEWQWFGRMDSRKALQALAELIEEHRLGKPLRKRRDPKRAGKRRG